MYSYFQTLRLASMFFLGMNLSLDSWKIGEIAGFERSKDGSQNTRSAVPIWPR